MFPFQQSGELSFQTTDFVGEEEQFNVENQIYWTDVASAEVGNMNTNVGLGQDNRERVRGRGRGRGRKSTFSPNNVISNCNDNSDEQKRKTIHKEVERQRRLEMSNLYSSLRSTLPAEYTKGKRSTSDHLAEAVNYIKDLENNVKGLADKRDRLKSESEWTAPTYHVGGSSNPRQCRGSVEIHPCVGGLDIDINVNYDDDSFCLSSALQVVYEEGLSVSSCTSTKVNEKIMHKIICEVTDISCIDFSRFHQRLIDLVS
ncbi:hypothetical protein BVRB_3g067340 [Beta vulgaris subsp. vulgaris]|uniref:BHLH domain-containing protein n=1 Tax=Beta vulgaris subsp. vulgaris TaxID=3555 RepID=A0A0J8BG10_BETVV|nr:transcription factor bHLH118 [Beta vulgaris subsp. vulgaris]KMS98933.1 hypothetical protein BVRB_3g067340 [Beta vulgaris subsp. vulgaris]